MSTAGTSTSTTAPNAGAVSEQAKVVIPDSTQTTLTTDVYGMFVGAFFVVLSLIVLFATGSILSVLVLWALIGLVVTVLVYYGFMTIEQLLGQVEKKAEEVQKEVPFSLPSGGPLVGSEVFHISDQQFTYDEAPAVCAAYGADLATLEQIMDAYSKGAEWCSYGWSAGGMALYPTQRETWERLQGEVDYGKRTRCGRPGVNGGYFDPNSKFGVNCFGFKPAGKFTPPAPVPGVDMERFRELLAKFKAMMKTMSVDPYSRQEWSMYGTAPNKEKFSLQSIFAPLQQDFFTPYGLKEDFEVGTQTYVEPIGQRGLGDVARSLEAPYGLRGGPGEKGDVGPAGPAGPAGPQGGIGPRGPQGEPGKEGPAGPTGPKGEKGDQGERGAPGVGSAGGIGPKGDKGDKGEKGDVGARGPEGPQGKQGVAGPQGPKGNDATVPKDLSVDSLKIAGFTIQQRPNQPNVLQVRGPNSGDAGFLFDQNGDWSQMFIRRGGNYKKYD